MSATLITRSGHETIVSYTRDFEWADMPGAGFGFDCDEQGVPVLRSPAAQANWDMCLAGQDAAGKLIIDHGIRRDERTVFNPATYACECGREFWGDGDTLCPCGRAYNAVGQSLDPHALTCDAYANGFECEHTLRE
jgi:hypothetical protein